ncbi:MAG TPA: SUMF1/EgtB/PvdO family nonheme iron enzyme, partial [Candidatus Cloacimonadota bacterium]|nr:SUMF1/EgtB/PvdO family nonheme iron enzyme [Candidatus Cloacimonadota bacterium]
AAKGGNKSKDFIYSGSNNINEVASYVENSDDELRDAGTKEVNELGIYDMSGSAWEWCWDRYSNSYYSRSPKNAPKGTNSGSERVRRGGAWSSDEIVCRVVLRLSDSPGTSYNDLGFRVVRTKK